MFDARTDVERLLRAAVPAWSAPGFSATSTINRSVFDDPYRQGFGVLDGLVYRAGGTSVIVTNRELLVRWLGDVEKRDHRVSLSPSIAEAFQQDDIWSSALAIDSGAEIQYIMPATASSGTDIVTVALADFTQDIEYDKPPTDILAAVVRGDRVFIADETLKLVLPPAKLCDARVKYEQTQGWSAPIPPSEKGLRWDQAVRDYRACYARLLHDSAAFDAVRKQAQALVDRLR